MKKIEFKSLSAKLTILILFMAATLSTTTILAAYEYYKDSMENHFITLGQNLTKTIVSIVDGEKIDYYLESGETDEEYDATLEFMRLFQQSNNIEYLYVVKPIEEGTYYIYDTDESEERCELGYFEYWYDDFSESSISFIAGGEIEPVISNESFGWLLSVYTPIYSENGTVYGYVGADILMDSVMIDRQHFLITLMLLTISITIGFILIYVYVFRRIIINPINKMAEAADDFLVDEKLPEKIPTHGSSISALEVNTGDELESLSNAMKSMEKKIKEYIVYLDLATKKANSDVLTNLYNRGAFELKVSQFLDNEAPMEGEYHSFMMIDIDHFKIINDTFGHMTGDEMLKECANELRRIFRSSDYVARVGGDEFAVFCKNAGDLSNVKEKAQLICDSWSKISAKGEGVHFISASVGISVAPNDGCTYKELYQKADIGLYQAKVEGRNRFVLYSLNDN